ncbi:hypothetical protein T01_11802 [Trichinella spiralis]|uniref:Uncharacterized protein n=1 Tax=Trichinella spiralis TaxID=6334 RepID=A0A0V1BM56_TRISP|nr:hypothetical protein T01_11802 [Trichinella spiralis]
MKYICRTIQRVKVLNHLCFFNKVNGRATVSGMYPICSANSVVDSCGTLGMNTFNLSSLYWTGRLERKECVKSNSPCFRSWDMCGA